MTDEQIAAVARRQALERALALMPDEIAAAARRALEQATAMAAMPLSREQAP